MAKASPPEVYQAYKKQYHGDLSTFLSLRAEETVPGARMVLTLVGRSVNDPSIKDDCRHFALLADTLHDLTTTVIYIYIKNIYYFTFQIVYINIFLKKTKILPNKVFFFFFFFWYYF